LIIVSCGKGDREIQNVINNDPRVNTYKYRDKDELTKDQNRIPFNVHQCIYLLELDNITLRRNQSLFFLRAF